MKKALTILAFMLLALSTSARSTLRGDVNGDGEVTTNDIAMIADHILGYTPAGFIIGNADVNHDGTIDINDIMLVVKIILEGDDEPTLLGDVNGDGEVTTNDLAMVVSYILGANVEGFIIANADVNRDGEIDVNDVMEIVKIILGVSGGGDDGEPKLPIFDDNNNTKPGSIITDGSEVL